MRTSLKRFGSVPSVLSTLVFAAAALGCRAETDSAQKSFESPQAAFDALMSGIKKNDDNALLDVLGHANKDLIVQSDKEETAAVRQRISNAATEFLSVKTEGDKATACLGKECWPYPIPVVKGAKGWSFDTAAGKEEILNRRIGRNELRAIKLVDFFENAQRTYAAQDRTGDKVMKYAQKLVSAPGKQDGLYWPAQGGAASPLGTYLNEDREFLEGDGMTKPYSGYYFKILTKQGDNAPNGKYDYVINGNMIAGFAIVAWPADYGSSGIMTLVMSHQGNIYQKDLGADTAKAAAALSEYNPDKTWTLVKPEER